MCLRWSRGCRRSVRCVWRVWTNPMILWSWWTKSSRTSKISTPPHTYDSDTETSADKRVHLEDFSHFSSSSPPQEQCKRGQELLGHLDQWSDMLSADLHVYEVKIHSFWAQLQDFSQRAKTTGKNIEQAVCLYRFLDQVRFEFDNSWWCYIALKTEKDANHAPPVPNIHTTWIYKGELVLFWIVSVGKCWYQVKESWVWMFCVTILRKVIFPSGLLISWNKINQNIWFQVIILISTCPFLKFYPFFMVTGKCKLQLQSLKHYSQFNISQSIFTIEK